MFSVAFQHGGRTHTKWMVLVGPDYRSAAWFRNVASDTWFRKLASGWRLTGIWWASGIVRCNVWKSHVRRNISKSGVRRNSSKSSARRNISESGVRHKISKSCVRRYFLWPWVRRAVRVRLCSAQCYAILHNCNLEELGLHHAECISGHIFSKAVFKCSWLLEQENLSKVGKYIGLFLK